MDEANVSEVPVLSFGQKAVGLSFNPSNMPVVDNVKRLSAALIDELNDQREKAKAENNGEAIRMYSVAITEVQTGQMWGVKAATWQN